MIAQEAPTHLDRSPALFKGISQSFIIGNQEFLFFFFLSLMV